MAVSSAAPKAGWRVRVEHSVRPWRRANRTARVLVILGLIITLGFMVLAIWSDEIAPYAEDQYCVTLDPETGRCAAGSEQLPERGPPSAMYPFGTTAQNLDVFSRVILGARAAFQVALFSTVFAMFIGVPLGLFSGYYGGRFDRVLVMLMDAIYALPSLLLALIVAFVLTAPPNPEAIPIVYAFQNINQALLGFVENLGVDADYVPAALAAGLVYIPQYYRVIRNHTLSVREEAFVEAARSLGAAPRTVIYRYVFFNVVQSVPVLFTLNAADGVLTLAGLGFLGIGITFPAAEWGADVSMSLSDIAAGVWWTAFWPGVAITLLVTGLTLLGEGLNDIINPLLRVKGYRGKVKVRDRLEPVSGSPALIAAGAEAPPLMEPMTEPGDKHVEIP